MGVDASTPSINDNQLESYSQSSKKSTVFKFNKFKKETGKNISNEWLEWLVGLFEGDGTIISRDKGFTFFIYSVHKPTLENIKLELGFGTIIYNWDKEKYTYLVEKRANIYLILTLLNGNLVLNHRYHQFISVSNDFNNKPFKGKPYLNTVKICTNQVLPSLNDAWLSGFVDAEGHFGLPIESGRKFISRYISISFEIGQNGEKWLFIHLKELFKGGIIFTSKTKKGDDYNRIIFKGSKLGNNPVTLVFDYFKKYPVKRKFTIYTEWRDIHKSLLSKEHLNTSKFPHLLSRCEALNDKKMT
uniref:LAGLIDADG endonuclease n=1 Tax=Ramaria cf. rubripermanens TaxID=2016387 RepID=UPI002237E50F|nr:LAGLIDADG endonuclease [Ramaria cf. rubripermanens]UYR22151.1 LAGLIDADG endonuclease [Ramaria cf. rubripermanens]